MKWVRTAIGAVIAISVIPIILLTVIHVTELKDVKNVHFELLSEEDGDNSFFITPGTYDKLIEYKNIIKYNIESKYPLITQEEIDRATWKIDDNLKNEIYIDENGEKRIRENVMQITLNGSEEWFELSPASNHSGYYSMEIKIPNSVRDSFINSYNAPNTYLWEEFRDAAEIIFHPSTYYSLFVKLPANNEAEFRQYLSDNPLTITYELMVKNPKTKFIESSDLTITSDYVRMIKPNDFSNNPDGLLISNLIFISNNRIDRFEITSDWIYIYPKDNIMVEELGSLLVGETLIYELAQPRTVEVYDFSTFKLTYDNNRIRVLFDIDDGYYLWEITNDDRLIPINGQYDLGNIWTVKFYVYEIQQPLIRSIVLLIPLIVISGLLLYLYKLVNERR